MTEPIVLGAGRYRLDRRIGAGGMGVVYQAWDTLIDRAVAVKLLGATVAGEDPVVRDRFRREARLAGGLHHDNLVQILDFVEEGDQVAIVMELVEGIPLDRIIAGQGALAPATARQIVRQLLAGIGAAHAAGIVHRDLKPANVVVSADWQAKIIDFGIAKNPSDELTAHGTVFGTLGFMAPELYRGEQASARSDLFAIGALSYLIVTGTPPFGRGDVAALSHATLHLTPEYAHSGWSREPLLASVTRMLLCKDAHGRPPSAEAAVRWLDGIEPLPKAVDTPADATIRVLSSGGGTDVVAGSPSRRPLQRHLRWGLLFALILGVAAVAWGGVQGLRREKFYAARSASGGTIEPPSHSASVPDHEPNATDAPQDSTTPVMNPPPAPSAATVVPASRRTPVHDTDPVQPTAFELDRAQVTLEAGEGVRIGIMGHSPGEATWVSSDPGVVAITGPGELTAVSGGEAIVSVTMAGTTVALPVTVRGRPGRTTSRPLANPAALDSAVVAAVRVGDDAALSRALSVCGRAAATDRGTPVAVLAAQAGRADLVRLLLLYGLPLRGDVMRAAIAEAERRGHATTVDALKAFQASGVGRQACSP